MVPSMYNGSQVGIPAVDESLLACPFCKLDPDKWMLHHKCGKYKGRKKLYDFVRASYHVPIPFKRSLTILKWHVLNTHKLYNEKLAQDDGHYVNPDMFRILDDWLHTRGKAWGKPELRWLEVCKIVADGLGVQIPGSLTPYWNEAWFRECWPGRMHAIDTALTSQDLESTTRVLIKEIQVLKQESDDKVVRLKRVGQSMGGTNDVVNAEIHDVRFKERQRLQHLKRQLLVAVESPRVAHTLLQEIGAQLGEERCSGWLTESQLGSPAQHAHDLLPNHGPASQLPVTRTQFQTQARWPDGTASSSSQPHFSDQVSVEFPHSPATVATEYSTFGHAQSFEATRSLNAEKWPPYEVSYGGTYIDQGMDSPIQNNAFFNPHRNQQMPAPLSFHHHIVDASYQPPNGSFHPPFY